MVSKKATFGAGCFWHVEEEFNKLNGVVKTTVGYMGGTLKNPTYEEVSTSKTGHVEVCLVEYNPKEISYDELLSVFWKVHNPTEVHRTYLGLESQYRSIIFYYDETQRKKAIISKEKEQRDYDRKIQTKILKAKTFYKAEEYHQKYFMKNKSKTCGIKI